MDYFSNNPMDYLINHPIIKWIIWQTIQSKNGLFDKQSNLENGLFDKQSNKKNGLFDKQSNHWKNGLFDK